MRSFTLMLKGPPGCGKTVFLNWLKGNISKQFKVIELSHKEHAASIEQVIIPFPEKEKTNESNTTA